MTESELPQASRKLAARAQERGFAIEISIMPDSTRTAEDAAAACKVTVGQIVKSLVFEDAETGDPLMFLVSGTNRLNEKTVRAHTGRKVKRADADAVRKVTGFAIGGIPPFGHAASLSTWIDEDLLSHITVWAAAGTPNAVFAVNPTKLRDAVEAKVLRVA